MVVMLSMSFMRSELDRVEFVVYDCFVYIIEFTRGERGNDKLPSYLIVFIYEICESH